VPRNPIAYAALLLALFGLCWPRYAAGSILVPVDSAGSKQVVDHALLRADFSTFVSIKP